MKVEWTSDPRAFVARDWTEMVDADPDGTVFHSPRYLKPYWEEFGGGGVLHIAAVRDGRKDVAVAAFELRHGVLTWLGGLDVTDYLGPIGLPEHRSEAARALMEAVAKRTDWTDANLAGLPENGQWLAPLAEAAGTAGLKVDTAEDDVAPMVELPDTYEEYLAGLASKHRHEIRRKERRIGEALGGFRLVDSTAETVGQDLDRFVELHRSSPGQKGKFMVAGMELFFHRLARSLLADGTLRLTFIEAEGEKIAGAVGFRSGDRVLLYNSAYDHARAELAPGMILVAELIRTAIGEGCRRFDLLKGNLPYKYRFGAHPRRICRLILRKP